MVLAVEPVVRDRDPAHAEQPVCVAGIAPALIVIGEQKLGEIVHVEPTFENAPLGLGV